MIMSVLELKDKHALENVLPGTDD